ncbi:nuclear transport factor 2 family protein [Microbacterium sp. AZCO]|uniref:nuclear transport factor 2 family protein n=1 Tax=Microbacterium sp. AZCO TaxID=3142976 RepID=UPI0031F41757
MSTVAELLHANLHDVFGNRDAASRRAAIERTYAPDVTFTDPEEAVTGWDDLEAKAAALLEKAPAEFAFVDDGRPYASESRGALGWAFGPAGAPVVRGIDVITVRDGVITAVETFFAAE